MARQNAKPLIKQLVNLGKTREQLAVDLQVSLSTVACWSKAERRPSALAYDKLIEIYAVLKKQAKKAEAKK